MNVKLYDQICYVLLAVVLDGGPCVLFNVKGYVNIKYQEASKIQNIP